MHTLFIQQIQCIGVIGYLASMFWRTRGVCVKVSFLYKLELGWEGGHQALGSVYFPLGPSGC